MPLDIVLSKKDFEQIKWQELIDTAEVKECYSYKKLFDAKLTEVEERGNKKEVLIFSLLGSISSLRITTPASIDPFAPKSFSSYPQNTLLENISDSYLGVLEEILVTVTDPEMKARIADVIWLKKPKIHVAEIAIEAYLNSFENLFDPHHWTTCLIRIERAFFIARKVGKEKTPFQNVVNSIEKAIKRCNGEDDLYLSEKLMDILINNKLTNNSEEFIDLSEKAAKRAEGKKNWKVARAYWECNARWHKLKKNPDSKRKSLNFKAETYVKQSEEMLKNSPPTYTMAAAYLQEAIRSLKNVEKTSERIKELHQILLSLQKESMSEMIPIRQEGIDISDSILTTVTLVEGKSFTEKLSILSTYSSSPTFDILRAKANKSNEKNLLDKVLPDVMLSETGKVTGKQPISENPKDKETFLRNSMYQEAKNFQLSIAATFIDPIRMQILLEHSDINIGSILPLVQDNPFIPKGREEIYAKGLYAGLVGDFVISTHLLIPQLENSIRHILNQNGIITSDHKSNGTQEEKGLGSLLYMDELSELLTKDVAFDLQGLLVESFGSNLRHKTAHGLIDSDKFNSTSPLYLWWIILQICYDFKIISLTNGDNTT